MQRHIDHTAAEAAHAALLGALAQRAIRSDLTGHGLGNAETVRRCTALMRESTQTMRDVAQRPAFDRDYGHYTGHPMDPRSPEPAADAVSEDDAQALAESEVCTTTEPLADWLAKKCDCDQGRAPIDTSRLQDIDLIDSDRVPVLLAALFDGTADLQRVAIDRLRALYLKAERKTVAARAAELLAAS